MSFTSLVFLGFVNMITIIIFLRIINKLKSTNILISNSDKYCGIKFACYLMNLVSRGLPLVNLVLLACYTEPYIIQDTVPFGIVIPHIVINCAFSLMFAIDGFLISQYTIELLVSNKVNELMIN